jgi:hypothetical protein
VELKVSRRDFCRTRTNVLQFQFLNMCQVRGTVPATNNTTGLIITCFNLHVSLISCATFSYLLILSLRDFIKFLAAAVTSHYTSGT